MSTFLAYDPMGRRIVVREQNATPAFWDARWERDAERAQRTVAARPTWVSRLTRRFMKPRDGLIVEGGCGTALHVAALDAAGYLCVGVDYAEQTLAATKAAAPHLSLATGDVFHLALAAGCAHAYWSLGVIEHYWTGYRPILEEAARVLHRGGLLFLSFPAMSPLRRLKAVTGGYPVCGTAEEPPDFYQFLLDPRPVIDAVTAFGFALIHRHAVAGLIGAKSDLPFARGALRRLERYSGRSRLIRGGRAVLDRLLAPAAGHSVVLVFRRTPA